MPKIWIWDCSKVLVVWGDSHGEAYDGKRFSVFKNYIALL